MSLPSEISGLVATRLCHDLAGPIGAVTSAAELVRELGRDSTEEDVAMVSRPAERAGNLLQLYRIAFGLSGGGQDLNRASFGELLTSLEAPGRVGLMLVGGEAGTISRANAQVAGLMGLAAKKMLGLRGQIRLTLPHLPGDLPAVSAKGERAEMNDEMRALCAEPTTPFTDPSLVEFPLIAVTVARLPASLEIAADQG
ncbi:MAG: hypothetical protein AAGI70_06445, partial [Pseudomonadota bacterium]